MAEAGEVSRGETHTRFRDRSAICTNGCRRPDNQPGRHARVLVEKDGRTFTQKMVRNRVRWVSQKARLEHWGVHILRHTFCSHLAMRGAPARAIQELAGHQNLSTTQRYMHLSPAALDSAIRLLDGPKPVPTFGDMLETGGAPIGK